MVNMRNKLKFEQLGYLSFNTRNQSAVLFIIDKILNLVNFPVFLRSSPLHSLPLAASL